MPPVDSGGHFQRRPATRVIARQWMQHPDPALLAGSPAIDAGDTASCSATDQRGVSRTQGAACDIKAYERSRTYGQLETGHWFTLFVNVTATRKRVWVHYRTVHDRRMTTSECQW